MRFYWQLGVVLSTGRCGYPSPPGLPVIFVADRFQHTPFLSTSIDFSQVALAFSPEMSTFVDFSQVAHAFSPEKMKEKDPKQKKDEKSMECLV